MNNVSSSSQLVGEREASRRQALRVVKKQNFRHVIHSNPVSDTQREEVLREIAGAILNIARQDAITLVAVDGVDGAGKTTLADELAPLLEAAGKPVIRATVDVLLRPELRDYWDFSVLLDVPWEKNHHLSRQPSWNVGLPDPSSAQHRYAEGQRIYIRECDPKKAASMVIDDADLAAPVIVKRRE